MKKKNPLYDKEGYNDRIYLSEHYKSILLSDVFFDYRELGIQSDGFYHLERFTLPKKSRYNTGFRICRTKDLK